MDDLEFGTKSDEFQQTAEEFSNRIHVEKNENIAGNRSIRKKLKKIVFFLSGIVAAGVVSTNSPSQNADAVETAQREEFPYLYEMEPMFEQLVYMLDEEETYQNIYIELEKHTDAFWYPILEQYAKKTNGMSAFFEDYYYNMEEHEFYHLNNNLLNDRKRGLVLSFDNVGNQLSVSIAYASLFNVISYENDVFLTYYFRQDNASASSSLEYLLGDFDEQFSSKTAYDGFIYRSENGDIKDSSHIESEVKYGYYVWVRDDDGNKKMFPKDNFDNYIIYNTKCDFEDIKNHSELPIGVYLYENNSEEYPIQISVQLDGFSKNSYKKNMSTPGLLSRLGPDPLYQFLLSTYDSFLEWELLEPSYVIQDCPFPLPVE